MQHNWLIINDFFEFLNFTNNIIIPNKINNDIIITENGN